MGDRVASCTRLATVSSHAIAYFYASARNSSLVQFLCQSGLGGQECEEIDETYAGHILDMVDARLLRSPSTAVHLVPVRCLLHESVARGSCVLFSVRGPFQVLRIQIQILLLSRFLRSDRCGRSEFTGAWELRRWVVVKRMAGRGGTNGLCEIWRLGA